MADTIKGGAYQAPDGSWHDANGKPLSSAQAQAAQALKRERAAEQAKVDQILAENAVSTVTPPDSLEDEELEVAPKRGKSRKS